MEEQNNNPNQVTPDTTPDAVPVTTPDTAPIPQTETLNVPKPPDKAKRAWSFISTNSTVLDLFVNTLTFLIVACFGTWLILNQNGLMENQNKLIQQQMFLDEASRRGALITLMSNIMDKVDDEIKEQRSELLKKGISKSAADTLKYSLSQSLIGQIAALSHSLKPYRFIEEDTLLSQSYSPERGQMLILISLLPLDEKTLKSIFSTSTFRRSHLYSSNFYKSKFHKAVLSGSILTVSRFSFADLSKADLSWTNLSYCVAYNVNLSGADLRIADLRSAILTEANLTGANLTEANLTGANLTRANLTGADLTGAKVTSKQLSNVSTLYDVQNLNDSIKIILTQSHPQLFQKPKGKEVE
jgi:uncharacterized protein YjbI with pentapeptide repeats